MTYTDAGVQPYLYQTQGPPVTYESLRRPTSESFLVNSTHVWGLISLHLHAACVGRNSTKTGKANPHRRAGFKPDRALFGKNVGAPPSHKFLTLMYKNIR